MKIINRKKIYSAVFSALAFGVFSSCEIGLGPAVDLTAPEIEITSHRDNDSVGSIFAVKGTAYDNEGVTELKIDFPDADMHYKVIPSSGEWMKKFYNDADWETVTGDPDYYCNVDGGYIEWSIGVDSSSKVNTKTDNSFTFEAVVSDKMGNSGRKSKAVCTLTVDENSPSVSVYKPELFTGNYAAVVSSTSLYSLKDGNVISRLMNGDIVLSGRQDKALSFKTLRIEFDNGAQSSGLAKITSGNAVDSIDQLLLLPEASLGDSPTVYYAKNITGSDLREWSLTVKPEEWVNSNYGLDKGKHIIRVVSTSLSTSNAWERKILGYFVWWPEADKPWIIASTGDATESQSPVECYPGSTISGSAQDDDGIKTLSTTMYKLDSDGNYKKYTAEGYVNPVNHTLSQDGAKYSAWSVNVPSGNGKYKYVTTVEDLKGNADTVERYFKTSDVSAPKITIDSPLDNSSAIVNEAGNITFKVKATDDGEIKNVAMVWLNPAYKSNYNNKLKYLTGTDANWDKATEVGWADENGNIIYRLDGGDSKSSYEITKKFNLYTDFKIGQTINGKERPLTAQDFIFLASDGSSNTVKAITLSGDTLSPEQLEFTDITINGTTKTFSGDVPVFPASAKGNEATITGKWKDMFTSTLENKTRLHPLTVQWGDNTVEGTLNTTNGKWTAKIIAPENGGTITATLKDFGGNSKVVQEAASIESAESGLSRIDCLSDDGSYKSGSTIKITLEFTKNTNVVGTPKLELSNGGIAVYTSGDGETSHVFEYAVTSTSKDTGDDPLYVTKIDPNGAVWKEASTGLDISDKVKFDSTALKDNIKTSRKIRIDNTKPTVKSITSLSSTGYYKAGGTVLFMVEFSEDVEISDIDGLNMEFKHVNVSNVKTGSASTAGSRYALLTYEIVDGDNASPLQYNKLNGTGVTVKDEAGNELNSWTPKETPAFAGIVVDTSAPSAPVFKDSTGTSNWAPASLITAESGTGFTITGESGASIEYSIDDGQNWLPYNSAVNLVNNGTYRVKARQTDHAGNVSPATAAKVFTINKGKLLKKITATTTSGTYTDNKTGVSANDVYINGKIEFRTAITVPEGANVTLNAKNGGSNIVVPIEECKTSPSIASAFTFKYKVSSGDSISGNGNLDVIGWSLGATKLGTETVTIGFPTSGNGETFAENREIKILTGGVSVAKKADGITDDVSFAGEGSDAVLTVKFNRNISKIKGDIVFRYYDTVSDAGVIEATVSDTTTNDFHVPVVLTSEEYGELAAVSTVIKNAYVVGMNGATASGSALTNDTSTKYILDYGKTDTDTAIVAEFKSAKKNIVEVPVISDAVSVDGNILKVRLGETYMLPVRGAKYKITIPAGAVNDEVQNKNSIVSFVQSSAGVEEPRIRLKKTAYSITGTKGDTKSANAKMEDAQKAYMKIDCRTPGATIKYNKTEKTSTEVRVNQSPKTFTTLTTNVTVSDPSTDYTGEVTLGANNSVSSYSNAQGLKIAISASATLNGKTKYSYELANRTVLKFVISGKYDKGEGSSEKVTSIVENGSALKFADLRVWVIGGDAPSGTNTLDPYPLSWGDNRNFKLMQQSTISKTYTNGNLYNEWWWVTWDVTAPTYHGFALGDVPADVDKDGPTRWYVGECAWVATKRDYILYPGETLTMAIEEAGTYHNSFLFRLKNEGSR